MRRVVVGRDFGRWRDAARRLLAAEVDPGGVIFTDEAQDALPGLTQPLPPDGTSPPPNLPRRFLGQLRLAGHHRDPDRWQLLYRLVWRLTREDRRLLTNLSDPDLRQLDGMTKAVRRDIHKTHAFVRFRKIEDDGGERYVAWHRPEQLSLPLSVPFFRDRFRVMRWSILTPDESAHWEGAEVKGEGHEVRFTEGVPRRAAPDADALEELWITYYRHIFNPARIKLRAMKAELPMRHWPTLPETAAIPSMLAEADHRVQKMAAATRTPKTSAADYLPPEPKSLDQLREAAAGCRGCPLWEPATQTVFGRGPATARVMFVGEQPGDNEDRLGEPFVGPAGQLMDELLDEAGVDRSLVYVTNTVKHFKHEMKGTFRLHKKPGAREINACKPWLEAEIGQVKPDMIVALGAMAAQALMGRDFRVTQSRGEVMDSGRGASKFMATIHPSAILRIPDDEPRAKAKADFVHDMRRVAKQLA